MADDKRQRRTQLKPWQGGSTSPDGQSPEKPGPPAGRGPEGPQPGGRKGDDKKKSDGKKPNKGQPEKRSWFPWLLTPLFILAFYYLFFGQSEYTPISTSEGIAILQDAEPGDVERAVITEGAQTVRLDLADEVTVTDAEGEEQEAGDRVAFQYVDPQDEQVARLVAEAEPTNGYNSVVPQDSIWASLLIMAIPLLIILGFFIFLLPKLQQGGMGGFGKIKNRGAGLDKEMPDVTFEDVAGVDEAVEELGEIKEFLEKPEKFRNMGAKIPKGVLLYGPPGTGKTLLAKAVAGEAQVPFFSISGSEFVEMFVGVGASRVRDLFTKAKQSAPAIIFVDEIDAVGRSRGIGVGGGNDEREQTLNQLLVEMDGFDATTNVILIAATNRPDVLDQALLRPGRFDRQIAVDAPDLPGRTKILQVHAEGKPIAEGIELESIARRTPGFTGADLANLMNEAALLAARAGQDVVTLNDLDEAIDRVIAGPQRRTRVMNPDEKRMTAYHEGGHALAAAALNHTDPVTKVTILPRGRALGYTMVMPTEDRYSTSRNELLDQLVYALGGRVAEELVFHDPTTGASNDIQKATSIARKMVTEYGMSARVGAVRLVADDSDPMTRSAGGGPAEYSDRMAHVIDQEVRHLIDAAHDECWEIMTTNRHILDELATRLLEKETMLEKELAELFSSVIKSPERPLWLSSDDRPISTIPPIDYPEDS
ncbi:ATP-dependent metallopeptidase FtsH/Yme1/Tma family protein [Flaviflexus salsibiostraticola]|uniref:ATP-dependent zinc metalloprotease FtsH n=1 Tax=Flaviflexus salsibiostraticola TaxID=1282737 RepID=A0A3Q8WV88_9ACTO|nr:ATP-dependent metallopeptidase FtsH/Yme1/Tma family protein [Flaviflexus salsibiostraticola]